MIKRPMVWIAAAYLLGILSYRFNLKFLWVLFGLFLFLFSFTVILFKKKIPWNRYDLILLLAPVFFCLGFSGMKEGSVPCDVETAFTQKTKVTIQGVVKSLQGVAGNRVNIYIEDITVVTDRSIFCCGQILITTDSFHSLKIGNTIEVSGLITSFSHATNPGQFDEYNYYKANDVCCRMSGAEIRVIMEHTNYMKQFLFEIKQKVLHVYEAILPDKEAGIVSAMLLGEQMLLETEVKQHYQENGISHILAISGLHLSFIGMGIYSLLRKLSSVYFSIICSVVLVFAYSIMTGFSVSAKRAVIMLCVSLCAKMLGYTYDLLSGVSFAALVSLYSQPMMITQAGFLLSFGAILGIAVVYPVLSGLISKERLKWIYPLIQSFLISGSIQLMTIPVLLYFYFSIPTYGIILNLMILPFMTFVIGAAIMSGIAGGFLLFISEFIAGGVFYILKLYEFLCILFERLPYHTLVLGRLGSANLILYYLILAAVLILYQKLKKKAVFLLFILLIITVMKKNPKGVEIVFLDVGQGDSIFFQNEYGTSFLVDGGSSNVSKVGKYRIKPFLLSKGIAKVDYAFVTHADADHMNGILELMDENMISFLVLTNIVEKSAGYLELEALAVKQGIPVIYFETGDSLIEGDFILYCSYPEPFMTGTDTNGTSMILELTYKDFSMILTGDIDEKGELAALNKGRNFTILKVAHHGSKFSSKEPFLQQVLPMYSIISCGKYNSYGHPNTETLERLYAVSSKVFITADSGAILIFTDGWELTLKPMTDILN